MLHFISMNYFFREANSTDVLNQTLCPLGRWHRYLLLTIYMVWGQKGKQLPSAITENQNPVQTGMVSVYLVIQPDPDHNAAEEKKSKQATQ